MRPEENTITEIEALIEGKSCMTSEALYQGLGIPREFVSRPLRMMVADVMRRNGWVYRMHTPQHGAGQKSMWVNLNKIGVVDYRTVDGAYKSDEDVEKRMLDTAEEMIHVHVDELIAQVGWDAPNLTIRRRITRVLRRNGWIYQSVRLPGGKIVKRWINPTLMTNSARLREIMERRKNKEINDTSTQI